MMKVIDLDAYRRARQRPSEPGINWTMIGGCLFSVGLWAFIGWLTWRVFH